MVFDWLKGVRSAPKISIQPAGSRIRFEDSRFRPGLTESVCPFDFALVRGSDAKGVLAEFKRERPDTTPVLLGAPDEAALLFEFGQDRDESLEALAELADDLDLDDWLDQRRKKVDSDSEPDYPQPPRGPWPDSVQRDDRLVASLDLQTGNYLDEVVVALLPTGDSSLASAFLNFGGWNDCPGTAIHTAMARRWRKSHGAVLATNTHDVLEFLIQRPIASKDDALEMAMTQYFYCSDIVEQGCGTIENLAAALMGARVWYFWWD